MIATIFHNSKKHKIDLAKPIDISIPIDMSKKQINAWYIDVPKIFAEKFEGKEIKVSKGASANFNTIHFNPHSHITHTECVVHLTKEDYSVNKVLNNFFFYAEIVTVVPEPCGNDEVISKKQLHSVLGNKKREALAIRTLPNFSEKKTQQYSNTNPPYLSEEAAIYLIGKGIEHLLIDSPSIDKEKDKGLLLSHHAFGDTKGKIRFNSTITEFIYISNKIKDRTYFLNLMIAPFENDATPSKHVIYEILK